MEPSRLLEMFAAGASAVRRVLDDMDDLTLPGERPDQYRLDILADEVVVASLLAGGVGVLSEESGAHHPDRDVVVVVDPVDGSTNCSRGIPWYATSMAAVDEAGLLATMVVNQATGTTYTAVRGHGAFRDGRPISVGDHTEITGAVVAMNGWFPTRLPWAQYRALGATALDLCLLAEGGIEGFVDCVDENRPWDYLGAMLIVAEAGGVVADAFDREMVVLDHAATRCPVAAPTPELCAALVAARRTFDGTGAW